jgi:membrane-associated phospholipid phosphatase
MKIKLGRNDASSGALYVIVEEIGCRKSTPEPRNTVTFGPAFPSVLELGYSLTYALAPFSIVVLYIFNCRNRVDRFQFIFVLAVVLCCIQFPFWPSMPPRLLFPGEDFPAYDTVFRRFNWWLLGNWGIQTSVFPSAHVAEAFSTAFGMWRAMPESKWVTRFLLVMATLIALATVYGLYHYAADAAAGFAMAVLALAVGILTWRRTAGAKSHLT